MRGEQLNLFEDKYTKIDAMMDQVTGFWAYHAGMADGDGSFKSLSGTLVRHNNGPQK